MMSTLLSDLEQYPITLHHLQTTRIGRLLNDLRRREGVSSTMNSRIRNIIKAWRKMVDDAAAASGGGQPPPQPAELEPSHPQISSVSEPISKPSPQYSRNPPLSATLSASTSVNSPSYRGESRRIPSGVDPGSRHSRSGEPGPPSSAATVTYPHIASSRPSGSPSLPLNGDHRAVEDAQRISKRYAASPNLSDSGQHEVKKARSALPGTNGMKLSPVADDSLSHQSDKSHGSQRAARASNNAAVSSGKVKTTAVLLLEYGSLKPEITHEILAKDTKKEPALPTSVIPNAARPRHLQEKPPPLVKGRSKGRQSKGGDSSTQRVLPPTEAVSENGLVAEEKVGDYKVRKFFASMEHDSESSKMAEFSTSASTTPGMVDPGFPQASSHHLQMQEDSSTTPPDLLLPASLDVKLELFAERSEGAGVKKQKKAHRRIHRHRKIHVPVTNHLDYLPELPPLDVAPSEVQLGPEPAPPVTSGEAYLKEKLPGRNCFIVQRPMDSGSSTSQCHELTDSFMAPLDPVTNIHMLPWCCLHGHRDGGGFPEDSAVRLNTLVERELPW